jgi:hypothetical protein
VKSLWRLLGRVTGKWLYSTAQPLFHDHLAGLISAVGMLRSHVFRQNLMEGQLARLVNYTAELPLNPAVVREAIAGMGGEGIGKTLEGAGKGVEHVFSGVGGFVMSWGGRANLGKTLYCNIMHTYSIPNLGTEHVRGNRCFMTFNSGHTCARPFDPCTLLSVKLKLNLAPFMIRLYLLLCTQLKMTFIRRVTNTSLRTCNVGVRVLINGDRTEQGSFGTDTSSSYCLI